MDCCEASRARVDGRSWASVDGRDGLLRGAALECADCCEARRWSARSACEAFRAASVCVWMDVPGRVWMDAMEVVHV